MIADKLSRGGFVSNAAVSIFVAGAQRRVDQQRDPARAGRAVGNVLARSRIAGRRQHTDRPARQGGRSYGESGGLLLLDPQRERRRPRKFASILPACCATAISRQMSRLPNGDVVLVPEMDVFYIYGEVQRPGRYRLERDMTVMQGLSVASGMTPRGSVKGIVLNRRDWRQGQIAAVATSTTACSPTTSFTSRRLCSEARSAQPYTDRYYDYELQAASRHRQGEISADPRHAG